MRKGEGRQEKLAAQETARKKRTLRHNHFRVAQPAPATASCWFASSGSPAWNLAHCTDFMKSIFTPPFVTSVPDTVTCSSIFSSNRSRAG